jgi:hypothetical protein
VFLSPHLLANWKRIFYWELLLQPALHNVTKPVKDHFGSTIPALLITYNDRAVSNDDTRSNAARSNGDSRSSNTPDNRRDSSK